MSIFDWFRSSRDNAESSTAENARAAAESGDAEAQFGLGLRLSSAAQNEPDWKAAADWYRLAADQGHPLAQFNLATMYSRGQGVARDDAASLAWTRRAAEGGDAGAQHALGRKLHRTTLNRMEGDHTESRIEAYKWFRLAALQGYTGSQAACDEMTVHMTRDDVTEGNKRATGFVKRITGTTN